MIQETIDNVAERMAFGPDKLRMREEAYRVPYYVHRLRVGTPEELGGYGVFQGINQDGFPRLQLGGVVIAGDYMGSSEYDKGAQRSAILRMVEKGIERSEVNIRVGDDQHEQPVYLIHKRFTNKVRKEGFLSSYRLFLSVDRFTRSEKLLKQPTKFEDMIVANEKGKKQPHNAWFDFHGFDTQGRVDMNRGNDVFYTFDWRVADKIFDFLTKLRKTEEEQRLKKQMVGRLVMALKAHMESKKYIPWTV